MLALDANIDLFLADMSQECEVLTDASLTELYLDYEVIDTR